MPPVLDTPEILDNPIPASHGDVHPGPSRRERPPVLAWLGRLFSPVPRRRGRQQAGGVPGASRFETPLDRLAREHPALHLQGMAFL